MADAASEPDTGLKRLRDLLRKLYHGRSPAAVRFQLAVHSRRSGNHSLLHCCRPCCRTRPAFLWLDYSIAALLAADIIARILASTDIVRWLRQPTVWVDIFITGDAAVADDICQSRFPAHSALVVARRAAVFSGVRSKRSAGANGARPVRP